jgi:anti-anti-sigma factor
VTAGKKRFQVEGATAMLQMAPGWNLDVDRGPDWLFVKLHCDPKNSWDSPPLAETLWALTEQHFTRRLVVECDDLQFLHSVLLGQLVLLHKRLTSQGGLLRLAGLSEQNQDVLRGCRLDGRFPAYDCRTDAIMGFRPDKPR